MTKKTCDTAILESKTKMSGNEVCVSFSLKKRRERNKKREEEKTKKNDSSE